MTKRSPFSIITIQGPTASGKSSFAMQLAEELNTEIISADSRQVYKLMDIGTAKPSIQEQKRIKHHLIDIVYPDEYYNAGRFSKEAETIIRDLNSQKKIPLIVGGTGFYIKALQEGLAAIPEIPAEFRDSSQKKYSNLPDLELHKYLASLDPVSSQRIKYQDRQKLLRAISVYEYTGKPISTYWQSDYPVQKFNSLNILITEEREKLYTRINTRIDEMIRSGLLNEVEFLLSKGYTKADPGMKTVGYQEFISHFENKSELAGCIDLAKQHTRNYAKRQFTWLKKCEFDLTLQQNSINFSKILKVIDNFLA